MADSIGTIGTIAILAAMSAELKPVLRALGLDAGRAGEVGFTCGDYRGVNVVTAVTNMGLVAAQRVTEELFSKFGAPGSWVRAKRLAVRLQRW